MAGVLTTASQVLCGPKITPPTPTPTHGGPVSVGSTAKLTVQGKPVLLESSISGQSVSGCQTQPASSGATPIALPCTLVTTVPQPAPPTPPPTPPPAITAGKATKLTVGKLPVMLDTLAGFTNGMVAQVSPVQALMATAQQTKLTAV